MGGDHDQVVIEFSFASDWLREWHSGPVTMGRKEISDYFQHPAEKCSSSLSSLISWGSLDHSPYYLDARLEPIGT